MLKHLNFFVYIFLSQVFSLSYNIYIVIRGKSCIWELTSFLSYLLRPIFKISPNSQPVNSGYTMFICNHRSWSDFTIDSALLGGPAYLSRMMVIVAVPFSGLVSWTSQAIWFFRRRKGLSRDWFTEFFRHNLTLRPNSSVIVYPEGTRSNESTPLKLKTGVFECAYKLDLPCQAVITTKKELCCNEKSLECIPNVELITCVSRSIHPKDFDTLEKWFDECKQIFDEAWADAYACKSEDAITLKSLPLKNTKTPIAESILPHRLFILRLVLILLIPIAWPALPFLIWNAFRNKVLAGN